MKILQLKSNNRELFADMDPLFKLEWVDMPGSFAVVAMDETAKDAEMARAGLIVCSAKTDMLIIEWLYVSPSYRGQGIADELLELAFEYAIKKNLSSVGARFCEYEDDDWEWGYAKGYFRDRFFNSFQSTPGEWLTDVSRLASGGLSTNKDAKIYPVTPLSKLSKEEQDSIIAKLEKRNAPSLYPLKDKVNTLDAEISVVIKNDDKIEGVLLFKSVTTSTKQLVKDSEIKISQVTTLYPVSFYLGNLQYAVSLIAGSMKRAYSKFSGDTAVRFVLRETNVSGLLNKICPGSKIDSYLMVARTIDYEEWRFYREFEGL